jgi:hypothetical protein
MSAARDRCRRFQGTKEGGRYRRMNTHGRDHAAEAVPAVATHCARFARARFACVRSQLKLPPPCHTVPVDCSGPPPRSH